MKYFFICLIPNIAFARSGDNISNILIVLAVVAGFISIVARIINNQATNKDSYLTKKSIDEHIKLILQTSYAAMFFMEDAKINGDLREQAQERLLAEDILKIHDAFLNRDLQMSELNFLLDTNKEYRRVFDDAGLKSTVGKFDDIIHPSIAENKTWDEVIDSYKSKMKWTER